jgi:hypothetical protein
MPPFIPAAASSRELVPSGAATAPHAAPHATHSPRPTRQVLRDDVIFLVFLYQRWIYPVDLLRKNEYGASGADYTAAAARAAGQRRVPLRSKYDVRAPPDTGSGEGLAATEAPTAADVTDGAPHAGREDASDGPRRRRQAPVAASR